MTPTELYLSLVHDIDRLIAFWKEQDEIERALDKATGEKYNGKITEVADEYFTFEVDGIEYDFDWDHGLPFPYTGGDQNPLCEKDSKPALYIREIMQHQEEKRKTLNRFMEDRGWLEGFPDECGTEYFKDEIVVTLPWFPTSVQCSAQFQDFSGNERL